MAGSGSSARLTAKGKIGGGSPAKATLLSPTTDGDSKKSSTPSPAAKNRSATRDTTSSGGLLSTLYRYVRSFCSHDATPRPWTVADVPSGEELNKRLKHQNKNLPCINTPDYDTSVLGVWQNRKGYKLFTRTFYPPAGAEKSKGCIFFHHGIQASCSEGFRNQQGHTLGAWCLAQELATSEGYTCYCYDAFSHGFSEGFFSKQASAGDATLADCDKFFLTSYEDIVDDYCDYVEHRMAAKANDGKKFFLYGESWGGACAILAGLRFQSGPAAPLLSARLRGVVLAAPMIDVKLPIFPIRMVLRYLIAPLFPTWRPIFMPHNTRVDALSEDPVVQMGV
mmetsp:Transcript_16642/g.41162  ORF Transcript_16642/g.41162 Transcript_16642/m.41162 type:complete len:337 (+) Transcript_16642:121-1131(+)|eukprot:CAMPEP_0178983874 /NCGR_PEP_ID=MMETSP0795-20121207/1300_1 /TAXON_ID=88552 /ORGANISM="Amoebophrya sp., Strain Ameob2" /LENGTH=336 /DNA_ID=CAMNT_0020674691 /DNA_START=65 /DNA_END=1075 /DNA_ORIENTATION=-